MRPRPLVCRMLVLAAIVSAAPSLDCAQTATIPENTRREVAVTFDDVPGVQTDGDNCKPNALERLNRRLLSRIQRNDVPVIGFVVESRLCGEQRQALPGLLSMWLNRGFQLGNHTYSHLDLNKTEVSAYERDILSGEAVTNQLLGAKGKRMEYFRYPYLHAGNDAVAKAEIQKFLAARNYRLAPVTIDNQEWMFAEVYARAVHEHDAALSLRIRGAYLVYMAEVFGFFERLSREVVGYEVKQILLLHDNPLNADCFDDLAKMMKRRGYSFITLEQALQDKAYAVPDSYVGPEGISWLHRWAFTKGLKIKQEPREPEWIDRLYKQAMQ